MKTVWRVIAALLVAVLLSAFGLTACGEDEVIERLPDVVTQNLPDDKAISQSVQGGFTIDIHKTYAVIVAYHGTDTEIVIPETAGGVPVKLIGEYAFGGNTKLTKVTFPSTVLIVGRYAFDGCSSLSEVVLNKGLETVRDYAFRDCGLTALNLPDSVAVIGKYSFYNTKIHTLDIPDGISRISKCAFYGCQELTSVSFGKRVRDIGEYAFGNCTSLTEILLPKTVEALEDYAFSGCTALSEVVISKHTSQFEKGVFSGCDTLTVCAPKGSAAQKYADSQNYKYESVNYDDRVGGES